jgi:hypothetical protein
MSDEVTTTATETVKQTSDGMVKITLEKYNELVETVANQKGTISSLRGTINKLRSDPPVVHRTVIQKTAEMAAEDNRIWGGTFMGLGAASFAVGVYRYRAGKS